MNKQDIAIVAALFLVLLGWMYYQNRVGRERAAAAAAAMAAETAARQTPAAVDNTGATSAGAIISAAPAQITASPASAETPLPPPSFPVEERSPEQLVTLTNNDMTVTLSSYGGAVAAVSLVRYRATMAAESGPVSFDFRDHPALRWEGLPGVPADAAYEIAPGATPGSAILAVRAANGLEITRRITLAERYRIEVSDTWHNSSPQPLASAATNWLALGSLHNGASRNDTMGGEACGTATDAKVRHFERDIVRAIGGGGGGCLGGGSRPLVANAVIPAAGDWRWVALKSRFFAQILLPEKACNDFRIEAQAASAGGKHSPIAGVRGAAAFAGFTLQPGETLERRATLYVGPKKLAIFSAMGQRLDEVMEFGTFKWFCKLMVPTLNFFHRVIPSYGIAIILLTILVRVLFWPLTHKSTESMKRMQTLQPQLKALQAQHKDNPQKLQQETWRIYRENKVNPLSSCLPMLVQIPIFIALYTVLRSAVELRFAPFLWIADLSEPENLLAGLLPIPLNILPILMAATMAVQSYLTPTGGDPTQQRMMMVLMPVMMLFMFYGMPAALSLYWTVSQGISILQMLLQRYRNRRAQGGGDGTVTVEPPPAMTRQMRRHGGATVK